MREEESLWFYIQRAALYSDTNSHINSIRLKFNKEFPLVLQHHLEPVQFFIDDLSLKGRCLKNQIVCRTVPSQWRRKKLPSKSAPMTFTSLPCHQGALSGSSRQCE